MNTRQQLLYAALSAACLLAGCGPNAPTAEAQRGTDAGERASGPAGASATAVNSCHVWLDVIASDDAHLREDARVRFSGPTQDGDYRLKAMANPSGKHEWVLSVDYDAMLDTPPNIFYAEVKVKGNDNEHEEETTHVYRITMDFEDGCPSHAILHTDKHPSVVGDDHGGDAEMD